MTNREPFIVEVDAFEGQDASITITDSAGAPLGAVYCIARRDEASECDDGLRPRQLRVL